MIAEGIRHLAVGVGELEHHPDNPRRGDIGTITKSLERFGQVRPIIALPDGTVIAGNHVLRAARQLGWEQVAVVRVALEPAEARAYLLADNRLSELGTYADEALADLLETIAQEHGLEGTGYTEDQVSKLIRKLRPDSPEEFPGFGHDIDTKYHCESCGYDWS